MEAVIFGVLIFVVGTLVIANAWSVIDAKMAAAAAAREATRAFVEAESGNSGVQDAENAAREAMRGHGRADAERATYQVPAPDELKRCARVTSTVTYRVPLVAIPVLGRAGGGFTVRASHAEIVDPFRSGLRDTSQCPDPLVP